MSLLLVLLGGATGAALRYVVDRAVAARVDEVLPWGTLAANTGACLLLGVLAGSATVGWLGQLAAVGFCGGLSTWSTFGYETVRLAGERAYWYALVNILLNLGCAGAALVAGFALGGLAR